MVCILSPPGVSSARANRRRACARRAPGIPPGGAPMAASSASSSSVVQRPSVSNTRFAMLAAAALVKVRQRIFSGCTPASRRLITRCARTCVLPDPALAATHAETPGSDTSPCNCSTAGGMMLGDLIAAVSCSTGNVVFGAAGGRPFLDACEVVVITVARLPHRMHERTIGLVVIIEPPHQDRKLFKGPIGLAVRRALLEIERHELAGARAALERHISKSRHRAAGWNRYRVEATPAQHGRFERELRRKSGADLPFGPQ